MPNLVCMLFWVALKKLLWDCKIFAHVNSLHLIYMKLNKNHHQIFLVFIPMIFSLFRDATGRQGPNWLFLIRVYWNPKSRQGPGLGGLASRGGPDIMLVIFRFSEKISSKRTFVDEKFHQRTWACKTQVALLVHSCRRHRCLFEKFAYLEIWKKISFITITYSKVKTKHCFNHESK